MPDSFTSKQIELDFDIISTGQTLTVTGHRVSCQILSAGLEIGVECNLRIEGLHMSDMNTLSTVQVGIIAQGINNVTVRAGDAGSNMPVIFKGGVVEAFVDYSGAPEVSFVVSALSMALAGAMPISATSYPNGAAVADIMQAIAKKAALNFENNGVIQHLGGSLYFCGTASDQIAAVASASRITSNVSNGLLSIWPPGIQAVSPGSIDVSSDTGLIGWPAYSQYGVTLRLVHNPNIIFRSTIQLKSNYAPAAWLNGNGQVNNLDGSKNIYPASSGSWVVVRIQHDLESETPGGVWDTYVIAARPDIAGRIAFAN